jgi:hypothetical protein
MKYLENKTKRLTAIGCQNGCLIVSLVDVAKNGLIFFSLLFNVEKNYFCLE